MSVGSYIYKKGVDWSLLHYGLNIPVSLQDIFYDNLNLTLTKGDNRRVVFIIENNEYPAVMTNIYFDKRKYPKHKDLVQIRYTENSVTAKTFRNIFASSYAFLSTIKDQLDNKKKQIKVPLENREYIAIYSTSLNDTFLVDCITTDELLSTKAVASGYSEYEFEQLYSLSDDSSGLIIKEKSVKIRKLDRTIGTKLKQAYGYKCQICGMFIGESYGARVAHTHHIEPYSISLNNNPDNIMVVCPNHHAIIHDVNPIFNRQEKVFIYPNNYVETLSLNLHL